MCCGLAERTSRRNVFIVRRNFPRKATNPPSRWVVGWSGEKWLAINLSAVCQMTLGMLSILLNHLSANEMPFEKLKPGLQSRLKLSLIKDLSYSRSRIRRVPFPINLGMLLMLLPLGLHIYLALGLPQETCWLASKSKSETNKKCKS